VKELIGGNKRAIAKAITIMEENQTESREILSQIYPYTGRAHIIGFTGPGGSGKSTLIEKLAKEFRKNGKKVGIIAVDPSSPFTGGAFLGDRIRMQELSVDEDVFIRSMATRNNVGGLAKATKNAVAVLDASGKDVVIVETVGAGQSEVDIIKVAQTIVVVFAPGLGDEIQAIKAGIMEIGDIFVVNKADRDNANKAVIDIQAILELNTTKKGWTPPVLKTSALSGEGVAELLNKINEHGRYLKTEASDIRRKKTAEAELIEAVRENIAQKVIEALKETGEFDELVNKILTRKVDPYSIADEILKEKIRRIKLSP
jgi:LAO/AO transport system kinase